MSPLQFLFLGTGTSTSLPLTPCLTRTMSYPSGWNYDVPEPKGPPPGTRAPPGHYDPQGPWPRDIECTCCRSAVDPDVPEGWKNRRGNTSGIVRTRGPDGKWRNILVDCGKTFLAQSGKFFPQWGVQTIDAVVLTHGHADAYFGLDDLREWCIRQRATIPIYLDQATYDIVAASFPYLVDKSKASGGGDIPTLRWCVFDDYSTMDICGVNVKSYPVYHGVYFGKQNGADGSGPCPLICQAFSFDDKVLFIGDVSEIPEQTWTRLLKNVQGSTAENGSLPTPSPTPSPCLTFPQLPVLVIDALWPLREHLSHFSLAQALTAALRLKPARTYTIGSTHPTSHFMWEEVCRSFNRLDGQRPDHPDAEYSRTLVQRVRDDPQFYGPNRLGQRWAEWGGGRIEPGWDGLVVQVGDDGKAVEVELHPAL